MDAQQQPPAPPPQPPPQTPGASAAEQDARTLYQTAFKSWQSDTTAYWQFFSFMSIVSAGLLAFVSSSDADSRVVAVAASASVVLGLIWWAGQRRFSAHIDYWDDKIVELEEAYGLATKLRVFSGRKSRTRIPKFSMRTRDAGTFVPFVFSLAGLLILGLSVRRIMSGAEATPSIVTPSQTSGSDTAWSLTVVPCCPARCRLPQPHVLKIEQRTGETWYLAADSARPAFWKPIPSDSERGAAH